MHDAATAHVAVRRGTEAARVQAESRWPWPKNLRPRDELHDRVREHEHDDHVDQGRQTEREREAADAADGEHVEHDGREEVHGVGRQDRAARTLPAGLDGRVERATLAQLVSDAFEVHDERVGGDADRDDQTCDTGQREPVALRPRQQRDEL